jgi:hypothetical protein
MYPDRKPGLSWPIRIGALVAAGIWVAAGVLLVVNSGWLR